MSSRHLTLEHLLYAFAFALALTLHFLHLGRLPLSDSEADLAFQALQIVRGAHPMIGTNPAYVLLTSILFFVFGASDFLARFWPALAGSLLSLMPFFFRDRLGRIPALILAFSLAMEPGLLALSRTAASSMLAIFFLASAWAMGRERSYPLAGVFGALALLSGPAVWMGLLILGLTIAIWQAFSPQQPQSDDRRPAAEDQPPIENRKSKIVNRKSKIVNHPSSLIYALATLLLFGSLFLLAPQGLSAFIASFLAFIKGWWTFLGAPVTYLLAALPAYHLMALIFGIIALVRGILARDRLVIGLGVWAGVALLLALAYSSHQVADLAWALLPLWTLAALELGRYTTREGVGSWELAGVVNMVIAILVFAWLNMAAAASPGAAADVIKTRLLVVLGALLILGLSIALVGFGWSAQLARLGAAWGGAAFLLAFTLGAATGAGGLHETPTVEFWTVTPKTVQADLLQKTLDNLSEWNKGHPEALPVMIAGLESPSLRWSLRDWEVKETRALSPVETPPLVITAQGVDLSLSADYRGEKFHWLQTPSWDTALPIDWLRWFVYRQMREQSESIVLWARNDLFLGGETPISP
jgi:hypothetical protein